MGADLSSKTARDVAERLFTSSAVETGAARRPVKTGLQFDGGEEHFPETRTSRNRRPALAVTFKESVGGRVVLPISLNGGILKRGEVRQGEELRSAPPDHSTRPWDG